MICIEAITLFRVCASNSLSLRVSVLNMASKKSVRCFLSLRPLALIAACFRVLQAHMLEMCGKTPSLLVVEMLHVSLCTAD